MADTAPTTTAATTTGAPTGPLPPEPPTVPPAPTCPRPQLRRAAWASLDGTWQLAYDDAGTGLLSGWYHGLPQERVRPVTVPFPPESAASGIGDTSYHPVVWYARRLSADDVVTAALSPRRPRLLLHLGAVDYRATVWLGGTQVAEHEGGHVPFTADLTTALSQWVSGLVRGRTDLAGTLPQAPTSAAEVASAVRELLPAVSQEERPWLVVRAEDLPRDASQPRGKQEWRERPHVIWYSRTTGIWQPVWLEATADTYLTELVWVPSRACDEVRLEVATSQPVPSGTVLEAAVSWQGRELVRTSTTLPECRQASLTVPLREQVHGQRYEELLWSPEHPRLLDATVRLVPPAQGAAGDDAVPPQADEVTSYLGLRSVGWSHGSFLLNDRPYYLRAVLEQGFWPDTHLAAPCDAAVREEVELIKALGFNAARLHQKIEDPRFLYWADHLGLLVWGEMPAPYEFTTDAVTRTVAEWTAAVRRDRAHPCLVAWVPVNESWGVQHVGHRPEQQALTRALSDLTRALDPTRPVVSNDGWEHTTSDLLTIHDYEPRREVLAARYGSTQAVDEMVQGLGPAGRLIMAEGHRPSPGAPVILSEFGGIRYVPAASETAEAATAQAGTWGYSSATDAEDFEARLAAVLEPVHASPVLAGFCYTQLTDTMQEANGLADERRRPKIPAERIARIVVGTHPTA